MNNFTFREELRVKIALIYNRESQNVINLFGLPNREKIGKKTIKRITDALKKGGHQVIALEGDKDLVDRLEAVSYTHLRAHETVLDLVCRLLLEKKKKKKKNKKKPDT